MLGNPLLTQTTVDCEISSQVSPLTRASKQGKRRLCPYTLHPEVLIFKGALWGGKYDCTSTGSKRFVRTARFCPHLLHIPRYTCHMSFDLQSLYVDVFGSDSDSEAQHTKGSAGTFKQYPGLVLEKQALSAAHQVGKV